MPLRLTDLQRGEAAFAFEYQGETVNVTYRIGKLTYALRTRLLLGAGAHLDEATQREGKAVLEAWTTYHADLASLLVKWDVLGEDGKPMQPTAELLEQLPRDFIDALQKAMLDHQGANPQSGKDSGATSPPKA